MITEKTFLMEQTKAEEFDLNFSDQNMDVEKWQKAYFRILEWKNTWCIPYEVDLCARSDHSPFIKIVVPKDKALETEDWITQIGFKISYCEDITIGVIEGYVDGIDALFIN